MNWNFLVGI